MRCGNYAAAPAFEIDAVVEHRDAQLAEHGFVAAFHRIHGQRARIERGRLDRLALRVRIDVEKRMHAVNCPRHTFLFQHFVHALAQGGRRRGRLLAGIAVANDVERRDTRSSADRVRIVRAMMIDVLASCLVGRFVVEPVEYVPGSADGAARHAAREYLRHRRQVRRHAIKCLCTAGSDAKARHDFIEYQQNAVLFRDFAQCAQHFRRRGYRAGTAADRLQHDGSNVFAAGDGFFDGGNIVWRHQRRIASDLA